MSLEQVPPKTPILDAAEASGGRVGLVARLLRPFREWQAKRHRAKVQKHIDDVWHKPHVGEKDE